MVWLNIIKTPVKSDKKKTKVTKIFFLPLVLQFTISNKSFAKRKIKKIARRHEKSNLVQIKRSNRIKNKN